MTSPPDAVEQHEAALSQAFVAVLKAEEAARVAKSELEAATVSLQAHVGQAEHTLREAWDAVRSLLDETGEVEVILPGAALDYRIHWTTPRESVKVDPASLDALPDHLVRVERKPRLKEIGDHLKALAKAGHEMPNWAKLERGEPKLTWSAVKKVAG